MNPGNDPDALAYLAPLAQPRPMEPHERTGMIRRARRQPESGRSGTPGDVLKDLDRHAWLYGYEPPTAQSRQQLAAQLYGEHEAQKLMAQQPRPPRA